MRPSFLFIVADQHRADWLGCTGHPVLKTPNIDALAHTGTWNDAAHSVTKADLSAALIDELANQVDASPLSQRLA